MFAMEKIYRNIVEVRPDSIEAEPMSKISEGAIARVVFEDDEEDKQGIRRSLKYRQAQEV